MIYSCTNVISSGKIVHLADAWLQRQDRCQTEYESPVQIVNLSPAVLLLIQPRGLLRISCSAFPGGFENIREIFFVCDGRM